MNTSSYDLWHKIPVICLIRIKESIEGIPGLSRIVLFGSGARNELKVGSDLDLLILTDIPVPRALRGELASKLAEEKNGVATDIVFYTEAEFDASDCLLAREIRKDGRIIWEVEHA